MIYKAPKSIWIRARWEGVVIMG